MNVPYIDHNGQEATISKAEMISCGATHSFTAYVTGVPDLHNSATRTVIGLMDRLDDQAIGELIGMSRIHAMMKRRRLGLQRKHCSLWTEAEIELLRNAECLEAFCETSGRTIEAARDRAKTSGISIRTSYLPIWRKWTQKEVRILKASDNLQEASKALSRPYDSIRFKARSLGLRWDRGGKVMKH